MLIALILSTTSFCMSQKKNRAREFEIVNLDKLQNFVSMGRIIPKENGMITMRDLLHCGLISQVQDGVKILSNVRTSLTISIRGLLIEKSRFNYPIFPYFV